MNPGRELDALIAEKVMGLSKVGYALEPYSTDIAAAWEVVEKMKLMKFNRDSYVDQVLGWKIDVLQDEYEVRIMDQHWNTWEISTCSSLPHAICLVTLKAVGYEFK